MKKFKEFTLVDQLLLRLTYCKGIGSVGKAKILRFLLQHPSGEYHAVHLSQIAELTKTKQLFIESYQGLSDALLKERLLHQHVITFFDAHYPEQLKRIDDPPIVLFYLGDISYLSMAKLIGIVGARQATSYAYRVVDQFVPKLVQRDIGIVSGLAKGVDHRAHQATMFHHGKTIGVVACGLDRCYPKEVLPAFRDMRSQQLIISEYPMGTTPKKHHFPMRNRIIAGLSDGICVVEAKQRSGALITAQLALDYGKDVFAVPGEIFSGQSQGCHELILDGATCTTFVQQILTETHFYREKT